MHDDSASTLGAAPRAPGVSVVIPALNEAGAIELTVLAVRRMFDAAGIAPAEIIVVDDGSSDDTGALARAAGATVVRHPHNIGYGRALKDGILAARHATIVITDADGTYPIERIPAMLTAYAEGFDMVVGARTGSHYRGNVLKAPLRSILKFLVEYTAGRRIPDINSGLRLFDRQTVIPYFPHLCNTFSFTTSLTLAYMMTGRYVAYLPIAYHERIGNSKVRLLRESLRTLQYIVQAIIYYNPIKIFVLLSGACLLLAVASTVLGVMLQIKSAFFLAVGSILVAMIVFSLGLLADLLRQIMAK